MAPSRVDCYAFRLASELASKGLHPTGKINSNLFVDLKPVP
jgi:hypothetical protein